MKELGKISKTQLYLLWRNLTVAIIALIATICISKILPYYLGPVVALAISVGLYYYIYNTKLNHKDTCLVPCLMILDSVAGYAFVTIILNLIHIWGLWDLPQEFVFFTDPFIPALILGPVGFFVALYIYVRHNKLKLCRECKIQRTMGGQRGAVGVLNKEAHKQISNLMWLALALTVILWAYYFIFYIDINLNARDTYIFTWLAVLCLMVAELFFSIRYYNLYLDLKENNEIIAEEGDGNGVKTYLRFYVFCDNYMYVTQHAQDTNVLGREVIDTPFFTKQDLSSFMMTDPRTVITQMTGVKDGELKFFYGRQNLDENDHRLLRYFYFVDKKDDELPELETPGEWMSFNKIKYLYSTSSLRLAELAVYDISRLATIILTEKIFDQNGYRKSQIKTYNPSFDLNDVRKSDIDFQDDKWIEIANFNSDIPFFKLKKWWRNKFKSVSK